MSCRTILSRLMMCAVFLLLATAAQALPPTDPCSPNPCLHSGSCANVGGTPVCTCQPGFTGVNCETDIDECLSEPCVHGECSDGINDYNCGCDEGYTGENCETDIDECASDPCDHGTCMDEVNGYQCVCHDGFTGVLCETDIDECESNPCIHGDCQDHVNSYTCDCQAGFTGENCETDIDECASNPCVHGTCKDDINRFQCFCDEGFTGVLCNADINECESNPCVHGTCTNLENAYSCSCDSGWSGTNCDVQENVDLAAAQDSFLRAGNNNTNEGANLNLIISSDGHHRVLVNFELASLTGPVSQATLRLYIVHNSENWGNQGRTLDAHRVTVAWAEGDGANLQPGNLTSAEFSPFENRGDGPGVTWKCAVDSEVHNVATNCASPWNGGTYVATPTATVTIFKDFAGNSSLPPTTATMGWISFDVTDDVNDCLAASETQCGWLIRKTDESQQGRVEFASKEGAAALYDSQAGEPVAPQLLIQP